MRGKDPYIVTLCFLSLIPSGGISIKPSLSMDQMRADMGGAACTVGALYTVAKLKVPTYIKGTLLLLHTCNLQYFLIA